MDAEGTATGVAAVDGAGAAPLRAAAAQPRRQPELIEDPRHRQLPLEVGEIDVAVLADGGGVGMRWDGDNAEAVMALDALDQSGAGAPYCSLYLRAAA